MNGEIAYHQVSQYYCLWYTFNGNFSERSAQPAFVQSSQYKQQYNVCDLLNLTKKTLGRRQ